MQFLGMNARDDNDLIWIAEEAANSPLPPHWEQLENEFGEEYFYNTRTEQCLTTHPLEQHYRALYLKHKFPETNQAAQQTTPPEMAALLARADELLPPALRSALNITNASATSPGLDEQTAASPAKSMMSLAAAARDGVAVYWGGYAVCGCINSISVTNTNTPAELYPVAAAESSLFPSAVAPVHDASASLPLKIRVNVCSESPTSRSKHLRSPPIAGSSSRGLCTWAASVWWRLRSAVVSHGHCMAINETSVRWTVLQVNPAATAQFQS
jgi:hypothetical protein